MVKREEWETLVVAAEVVATLCTSFWLVTRRLGRVDGLPLSSEPAALLQPRSCWSLRALLAFRAGAATFFLLIQLWDVYRSGGRCFAFYTSWNFILQGAYFFKAAWRTRGQLQRRLDEGTASYTALIDDDGTGSPFARRKRVIRDSGLHWIDLELLLDVCLAASLLICIVVWTILYPYAVKTGHPERILNGVSYCQHGVNVVLLQIDFFATRHLVSRDALPLIMGWPAMYAVFAWIVHGTVARGFWPYPFLELDTPWAPFWYGGLLAAHILALMLVMVLSKVKHKQLRTIVVAEVKD